MTSLDAIGTVSSMSSSSVIERAPALAVRDLSFTFAGSRRPALRHISFSIHEGECLVVTGPSGCGKSTLALALAGYIPHVIEGTFAGEVRVHGVDTAAAELCDLALQVSLCQQDPESQLCTLTVADEVCFGPENLALPVDEVLARKQEALAALGIEHLDGRLVHRLSGGEKQRVAIASMLAMQPRVLILDEPTANLDPDAAAEVFQAIERLHATSNLTLLIVEHKLRRILPLADRMMVMEEGQIVLDGAPNDIVPQYRVRLAALLPPAPTPRPPSASPLLRVSQLSFRFPEREVLHEVSLEVERGEMVGIIGANGSGKTTLLNCVAGLARPEAGQIELDGQQLDQLDSRQIARRLGFVFQNPNHQIFENTVVDEVSFACRNFGLDPQAIAQDVTQLLKEYELDQYRYVLPLRLSHGEKRRLNLCSVLPHHPCLFILDEPFIGQDERNVARLLTALLQLRAAGNAVLLVSHEMNLVYRCCDRLLFFDAGRITAAGVPDAVARALAAQGHRSFLPEQA